LWAVGVQKCHLLVFKSNAGARDFWTKIGAEERESLVVFSIPTSGSKP
jgi:hypothetical protein